MEDAEWDGLHQMLRDSLEEEVRLTRELLSNMLQEELSLMLADQGTLGQVIQEQAHLLTRLSLLREKRHAITVKIEGILVAQKKIPCLEAILPPADLLTTEILSLSDQLLSLTEKMHHQHFSNQKLSKEPFPKAAHFQPLPLDPQKKKASIATYDLNQ